jgi:catechol 2,3-dioxygenase-like lactoylglutathione lyase family enzyme
MDMKLEGVLLPVADVDWAKQFYRALGWREDADFAGDDYRIVQLTSPGSGSSIQFGTGLTSAAPGSCEGLLLVVEDIEAARVELVARGAAVSEVCHDTGQLPRGALPLRGRQPAGTGAGPDHATYRSFASFRDPDGSGWVLQEITTRLPGRE